MKFFSKFAFAIVMTIVTICTSKAATVTIDFANEMARDAYVLAFNVNSKQSLKGDVFDVDNGDIIRFSFNTFEYNVNVNGKAIKPSPTDKYTNWESGPIEEDCTFTISASIREYGTTYVEIAVLDPDGIVMHDGHPDGPVVDMSTVEISKFDDDMYLLRVPVSLKVPKIFVYPAPDYYIKDSHIGEGRDLIETIMSTNNGMVLMVYDYKLSADNKLVYRVMCGTTGSFTGTADNAILSDKEGHRFDAVEGYNVYDVDANYVSPLRLRSMNVNIEGNSDFSVYLNGRVVTPDKDFGFFIMNINADAVIYAFIGRQPAVRRTISVEKPVNDVTSSIIYDKIMEVDPAADSFSVFNTAEVAVIPAPNCDVYLDDEMLTLSDGSATFSANKDYTLKIVEKSTSGVISVNEAVSNDSFSVVTVDGVVVYEAATKQQVDALPSGFYIVNGKKVIK